MYSLIVAAQLAQPLYWQDSTTQPDIVYLMQLGECHGDHCDPPKIVGGFSKMDGSYRPYNDATKVWGAEAKPPIAPPARKKLPTGVDSKRLKSAPYTFSGVPVTAEEATALALKDDSTLPHLTIVADKTNWRTVLDYFPADFKAGTRLHCYPPDHRDAKKFDPVGITAVFQEPDGRVVAKITNLDNKYLADDFVKLCIPAQPKPGPSILTPLLAGLAGLFLLFKRVR